MKISIAFAFFVFSVFITGCAPQKFYKNTRYTGNIQAFFNRDSSYCSAVALGQVPLQVPRVEGDTFSNTHGNITMRDNWGNTIDGSYSGNTTYYNPMAPLNNSMQLASMFGAANRRIEIENMCMSQLGWYEVPKEEHIESNRPRPQQNPKRIQQTGLSESDIEAQKQAFRERLQSEHPEFCNLNENERKIVLEKIRDWISKKPYSEAAPLMEVFERGNMDQILDLLSLYKRENTM